MNRNYASMRYNNVVHRPLLPSVYKYPIRYHHWHARYAVCI